MIKRLKPQGTKSRKGKSVHSEKEKVENDIDVLRMVRQINLDNIDLSSKFDSTNGHEHPPLKLKKDDRVHQNGDEHEATVATLGSIPKRRRSSSGQSTANLLKIVSKILFKCSIWCFSSTSDSNLLTLI